MFLIRRSLVLASITLAASAASHAQAAPPPNPRKLLSIFQEVVKPARNSSHEAHETGWPTTFAKAKSPVYSLALVSTTGNNDALYITAYPSFAELEKGVGWAEKVPGMQATLDRLAEKDAEFLVSTRATIASQQEDLTLGTPGELKGMHGFLIRTTRVKIGRGSDYEEYMKLVQEGYKKANVDPHVVSYAVTSGVPVPTFMTFRGFRSLAEMDEWPAQGSAMRAALSQEQRDKMDKLIEGAFTVRDAEIYMVSPKMSYMSMAHMNADPDFWKSSPPMQLAKAAQAMVEQAGAPKTKKP